MIPCPKLNCKRWFKKFWHCQRHNNPPFLNDTIWYPSSPEMHLPEEEEGNNNDEDEGGRHEKDDEDPEGEEKTFYGVDDRPYYRRYHRILSGRPCDVQGNYLAPDAIPPQEDPRSHDWAPFESQVHFELADFVYRRVQMSNGNIDALCKIAASLVKGPPPFKNHSDLYKTIDDISLRDVEWEAFTVEYSGDIPEDDAPPWMLAKYDVSFRDPRLIIQDMVSNTDYKDEFDYAPYREYDCDDLQRYHHFMSGDWAWKQAEALSKDNVYHGAMIVPMILGSDKTTTSVATGDNEYYPLYLSIGNVHNNVRRAHRDAVEVIGFLSVAKTDRQYKDNSLYRRFRRQLMQSTLEQILNRLKPGMTAPEIMRCPDGHYRRVVFCLGPYIADYPEQALIANIVNGWCPKCEEEDLGSGEKGQLRCQERTELLSTIHEFLFLWRNHGIVGDVSPFTNDLPRADIHELIAPDILHQIIKGVFKDHLVTWVEKYLIHIHGERCAKIILDDIDHRIALAPPFAGLRRFNTGRGFKQWTGDDSKALMKVYISAIEGHVPDDMVRTFRAFLEICYTVRREYIREGTLQELQGALKRFHEYRQVFMDIGVRNGFDLPRQHALVHYPDHIRLFGAPNGLCTSITENQHIRSVKVPWRRSNRNDPLEQMMGTNTRMSKLAAARLDFSRRGMLDNPILPGSARPAHDDAMDTIEDAEDSAIIDGPPTKTRVTLPKQRVYGENVVQLADEVNQPDFLDLIQQFLQNELGDQNIDIRENDPMDVFNSATAVIYSPSDPSGTGGMRRELIRSKTSWRSGSARHDCVFVKTENDPIAVARVRLFFRFSYKGEQFPCALVHWFTKPDNELNDTTDGTPVASVVHIDALVRAAHLLPVFGDDGFAPEGLEPEETLDYFDIFYINRYIDHHGFLIAS
ncbi:hypothetical protein JOM56_001844 [Amanita muscaria]